MVLLSAAVEFAASVPAVVSEVGLSDCLAQACDRLGIRYFALSHHVDFAASPQAMRVHNYPDGWEEWYDAHDGGLSDPIHRASHVTAAGFYWNEVSLIIPLTRADRRLLARGADIGLGDGVTVPSHVPGEARGSCTFVAQRGMPLPDNALIVAQTIGMFAFEIARKLHRSSNDIPAPKASHRQRQCIALAGRGMSNPGIARKLGIGEQSVMEHMRQARARFGVSTRTQLVVSLLASGEICLEDVRPRLTG